MTAATLTRRNALGAATAFSCTALAGVLSNPERARAAAEALEGVEITTPDGRKVTAALAKPGKTPAPALVVIHEWWGLNDQIKAFAKDMSDRGYLTLAVDLFGVPATDDPKLAAQQTNAVKPDEATATMTAWTTWLAKHAASKGKIATLGFCFGGGWSLNASLATPVDATVIYYGRVDKSPAELATLKGPVLGHFAKRDSYITDSMVQGFETSMKAAGKSLTAYRYDADHGFANPTTARYDAQDAALALSRTLNFLKRTIG